MSNFGQHDIGFFASQEHIIGYHGGPAVLIYSNRMLLFGFGSNLVMTDLLSQDILPQHGIWKGFVTDTSNNHRQSTLKGHSQTISHIEVFYIVLLFSFPFLLIMYIFYSKLYRFLQVIVSWQQLTAVKIVR